MIVHLEAVISHIVVGDIFLVGGWLFGPSPKTLGLLPHHGLDL